jgi:hypothetical protein
MFQVQFSSSPEDISQFVWFETSFIDPNKPLQSDILLPANYVTIVPIRISQMTGDRFWPNGEKLLEIKNAKVLEKMKIRV